MKLVVIESPYGTLPDGSRCSMDQIAENVVYAKACVRDCLNRGESPYASHLFFTQEGLLDDHDPTQRRRGMEAGFAWGAHAGIVAVYTDLGITQGMKEGTHRAFERGQIIIERKLDGYWGYWADLGVARSVLK